MSNKDIMKNISVANLERKEISTLQDYIDSKRDGEYELSEILGAYVWSKILRKRALGIAFRKYFSRGYFGNISSMRKTSDGHIHYTISRS